MLEGIYLNNNNVDPYTGDIVHEIPLILNGLKSIFKLINSSTFMLAFIYVCIDLLTAYLLYRISDETIRNKLNEQKQNLSKYAKDSTEIQYQAEDVWNIPKWVLLVYLFNPLSIGSCAALTSTVFSNFLLSCTLYFMIRKWFWPCICCLAVETMRNLYPITLIAPVVLVFAKPQRFAASTVGIVLAFTAGCAAVTGINFALSNSWSFLDGSLGFM